MRDPWPPTAMGGVFEKTFKTFVAWMPTEKCSALKMSKMFVLGLVLPLESTSTLATVGSSCRCLPLGVGPQVVPAEKAVLALASQE